MQSDGKLNWTGSMTRSVHVLVISKHEQAITVPDDVFHLTMTTSPLLTCANTIHLFSEFPPRMNPAGLFGIFSASGSLLKTSGVIGSSYIGVSNSNAIRVTSRLILRAQHFRVWFVLFMVFIVGYISLHNSGARRGDEATASRLEGHSKKNQEH
jgi:hypothetical protein